MVAVPGTQSGATKSTFDEECFLRDVHWPVKDFLTAVGETCPVLIFFLIGPDREYEEKIIISLPEQNEGEACPGYLAAEKHLHTEIKRGLVFLTCFGGEEAEHYEQAIGRFMASRHVEDRRLLPPSRLPELASELTSLVT
jgi:hypothetical protein